MTLLVRAHGDPNKIVIGLDNTYTIDDTKEIDFACLDVKATILLNTCFAGVQLAKKIAAFQQRPVFAPTGDLCESYLMPCCAEHGYGMIGFDTTGVMNVKKFQREGESVTEVVPCFATSKKVKQIKKILFKQLVRFASLNDASAQYSLGLAYEIGEGGLVQSPETAAQWYERAARQGLKNAQEKIAFAYLLGRGVIQSHEIAVQWFMKAANQESEIARHNLAVAYMLGRGVPQSLKTGIRWFKKAAKQGYAPAQYSLGRTYEADGKGILKSAKKALIWLRRAEKQEYMPARERVQQLMLLA